MDKWIAGLVGLPAGIIIIFFRFKIVQFTGKLPWAETNLGSGGTYNLMIIIGLIVWLGSLMWALGSFDGVLGFLSAFF
jgi:hypothetical protein